MRNGEILAVALAVLLGVLVVGCGLPRPRVVREAALALPAPECCDDACNFTSSLGCPVGPVPPRKGRRS